MKIGEYAHFIHSSGFLKLFTTLIRIINIEETGLEVTDNESAHIGHAE